MKTASSQDPLRRFAVEEEISRPLSVEEIRQKKLELVRGIRTADSIRDFGGLWGVHGLYLIEGARSLNCRFAEMIDVSADDEFLSNGRDLQRDLPVQLNMVQADFRSPQLFTVLAPVEVALLYDVLLHQDTAVAVIRGVTETTHGRICVAQPMLKEELFPLPNGAVNLQFYSEELKDELRTGSWWPKEEPVRRFDTSKWMWGQTPSYLESVFSGYGWLSEHLEVSDLGRYWNYGFMRFAPDQAVR